MNWKYLCNDERESVKEKRKKGKLCKLVNEEISPRWNQIFVQRALKKVAREGKKKLSQWQQRHFSS